MQLLSIVNSWVLLILVTFVVSNLVNRVENNFLVFTSYCLLFHPSLINSYCAMDRSSPIATRRSVL